MISDIEKKYGPCTIKRPSKYAENQYTLIRTQSHMFFALFKDGAGKVQESEISEDLYLELLQNARDDEARIRRDKRYLEQLDLTDEAMTNRAAVKQASIEEMLIHKELYGFVHVIIGELSDVQRRRISLYLQGKTYSEIAGIEGCTYQTIQKSILKIRERIKNFLKGGVCF